jgi:hypothetical protein
MQLDLMSHVVTRWGEDVRCPKCRSWLTFPFGARALGVVCGAAPWLAAALVGPSVLSSASPAAAGKIRLAAFLALFLVYFVTQAYVTMKTARGRLVLSGLGA